MQTTVMARMLMAALALTVMGGCGAGSPLGGGRSGAVEIVSQSHGNDPALREPTIKLINSAEEQAALGGGAVSMIPVDYRNQSLIVVALGEQPTDGFWVAIQGVQRAGGTIYMQAVANRPDPMQPVTMSLTYPYAAVVVRKVQGLLVPEIDQVQGQARPSDAPTANPEPVSSGPAGEPQPAGN